MDGTDSLIVKTKIKQRKKSKNKPAFPFSKEHPTQSSVCRCGVVGRPSCCWVVSVCPAALVAVDNEGLGMSVRGDAVSDGCLCLCLVCVVAGRCCILGLRICPACPNHHRVVASLNGWVGRGRKDRLVPPLLWAECPQLRLLGGHPWLEHLQGWGTHSSEQCQSLTILEVKNFLLKDH